MPQTANGLTIHGTPTGAGGQALDANFQTIDGWRTAEVAALATKAVKVVPATAGNFAGLDAGGNLIDSTRKHADYAFAVHAHAIADVTGLQAALDAKASASALTDNVGRTSAHGATATNTASRICQRDSLGNIYASGVFNDQGAFTIGGDGTINIVSNDLSVDFGASEIRNFAQLIPTDGLTVTGSRGGNAALESLLTQLDSLGLITNSTT